MDPQEGKAFTLLLIIVVTLGTIIAYFFISIIRQNRRTVKLQKAIVITELAAIEKERSRIASDLHDDVSPLLSVAKFQIDSVETLTEDDKAQLTAASLYIDDILHRVREVSNNLMPTSLRQKGLQAAINEYLSKISETTGIIIDYEFKAHIDIPEVLQTNIYRIIQEVIHNVRKHAGASKVEVRIYTIKNQIHIFIRDNGIGFDYKKTMAESIGIGLQSIKNRTHVLGGAMNLESELNTGTAFLFKIPL